MGRTAKFSMTMLAVGMIVALSSTASAQSLNTRETASPAANAKIGRAVSKARSLSAQQGDANLNRQTVNTDCSPVEIGNTDVPKNRPLNRNEQIVVVPGDVINVCR